MRCTSCGYDDYRHDISVCSQCQSPIYGRLPSRQLLAGQTSFPLATQVTNLALAQNMNTGGGNTSLQRVCRELYQSIEAVERGDPLWELFGKHRAAYRAKQHAKDAYPELVKIQQEAYLEMKRQLAGAELARREAEFMDAIQREQLMRRAGSLADFLSMLNQLFADARFASLPDEIKGDIINSLYKRGEEMMFTAPNMLYSNGYALPRYEDESVTIIDVDEF